MKKIFLGIFASSLLLLWFSFATNISAYTFDWYGTTHDFSSTTHTPSCLYSTPDGLHVFLCSQDNASIESYTLSTPWNPSSMSFTSSASIAYGSQGLVGISFINTGSTLYVLWKDGIVWQYSLSTPYDLSTLSLVNTFDISGQVTSAGGMFVKADGTKLYVISDTDSTLYQYSLTTPYDISTLSYDTISYDVNSVIGLAYPSFSDVYFSTDGARLYIADSVNSSSLFSLELSTPWDISTAAYSGDYLSTVWEDYWPSAAFISPLGDHMLMVWSFNNILYSYSTFSFTRHDHSNVPCLYVAPDGSSAFLCSHTTHTIDKYTFSPSWDFTTMTYDSSTGSDYDSQELQGISVVNSGNNLYTLWDSGTVGEYNLSTSHDLSTLSLIRTGDVSADVSGDVGWISMKEDGTKLYIVWRSTSIVYQYSLTTPYDLSTLSYDNISYDGSSAGIDKATSLFFNANGTSFYIANNETESAVYEFDLTTPWDISTASNTSALLNVDGHDYRPDSFSVNSGEYMFMTWSFSNILYWTGH